MGRPSKSTQVLESEGRSHRTKAELEQRKRAEAAAMTGLSLQESPQVAEDEIAHEEFTRTLELLAAVGRADALYESVINDYCIYKSDIARYTRMREAIQQDLDELDDTAMDAETRYRIKTGLYKHIMDCDKQIQAFQKKRFDIAKENGMTIASAARSIPKAPPTKGNPLLDVLGV